MEYMPRLLLKRDELMLADDEQECEMSRIYVKIWKKKVRFVARKEKDGHFGILDRKTDMYYPFPFENKDSLRQYLVCINEGMSFEGRPRKEYDGVRP